jgi:hypothetical protein
VCVPARPRGGNQQSHSFNLPITVVRAHGGDGWLVVRNGHGWLHGDFRSALDDSAELAAIELWGRR